ncbi:hypothetical protein NQ317_005449 [Molorchus minor]|uniref:ZAD domain-containing protein n=1 Tax=Molorchus minor TaxID=1323400 RepID=A0ABQ9IU35_9CUCU|nr:hypothetical protein NQ317_005449 [Molorchus minor]
MNNCQSCCVCLSHYPTLNELTVPNENDVTYLEKLEICVPQLEWHATYQICDPCTSLLKIVYRFRETCIKSDVIRKEQLLSIHPKMENELKYESTSPNNTTEENGTLNIKQVDNEDDDDDVFDETDDPSYTDEEHKMLIKAEFTEGGLPHCKSKRKTLNFNVKSVLIATYLVLL